ncbi:AbrB/MazE/SpoVT family DNA-binding domain-containing protein [Wukongibacter sp. M2B1]|uniref:AbrB/MazE/SpoVT family DNA-binding domain-containing protein n=1 Tax=Wukongibacter sp. M2B1 TaxID=3088895 RepID=UPI003D7A5D1C
MKPFGVRKIELSGRFPIPKEVREEISIKSDDPVEFFTDDGCIGIMKYKERCCICEANNDVKPFKNNFICQNCKDEIIIMANRKKEAC